MTGPSSAARTSPAAARNKDLILAVLKSCLPSSGLVLEIASGTGEHAAHMAAAAPGWRWLPTDADPAALASIGAWRDRASVDNLLAPLSLDAAAPETWTVDQADAVVAINMIHISPWSATEGLIVGATRVLGPGGVLFLYGPYLEAEVETAASNLAFDASLKTRDPRWGLRRLDAVAALAAGRGLHLTRRVAMPANNLALVFTKR